MDKPEVASEGTRTPLSASQVSTLKPCVPSTAAAATGESATVGAGAAMEKVEKTAADASDGAADAEAAEGMAVRSPAELEGERVEALRADSGGAVTQALSARASQSISQELSTAAGVLGVARRRACLERGPLFLGMATLR